MKPPVRGNGFVMYNSLEASFRSKMAMQDYLNRELPHTPFLVPQENKSILVVVRDQNSYTPVPKERSLIIIPRGQVTSLELKTVDTTKNSAHKKEVLTMMNRKVLLLVLAMLLLAVACYKFGYNRGAKSCSEVKALSVPPAATTPKVNSDPKPAATSAKKQTSSLKRGIRVTNNTGAELDLYYYQENNGNPIPTGRKIKVREIAEFPASKSELTLLFTGAGKDRRVHRTFQADHVFDVNLVQK